MNADKVSTSRFVARRYAFYIRDQLRQHAVQEGLKTERLPVWLHNTAVRVGRLNKTTFFLFKPSSKDELIDYREVVSDAQFILDLPDFILPGHQPSIDFRNDPSSTGTVSLRGESGDLGEAVIVFDQDKPIHLNAGYVPYHVPAMYHEMVFQWEPEGIPIISRHIPFLLYIHDLDLTDPDRLHNVVIDSLKDQIESLHDSPYGDTYESRLHLENVAQTDVGKSVIVLGGYDSQRRNEQIPRSIKQELLDIRTYLSSHKYRSHLIEDLYTPIEMALETKVRAYTATARFCVMVDREASGHIKEYEIAKQNRVPLVLFRPQSGGASTWMISDEELVDLNYIKTFEFEESALERMDDAIDWVEGILNERADAYEKHYPWR